MGISSMSDLVSQLRPAMHQTRDWPYPDEMDHSLFQAYMKVSHDVGGEPDAPAQFEEKQEERWELDAFITCEVLGWRGIWTSEERRRLADVDLGRTLYFGLPYYGRWVWAAARCLIDKHHITLTELVERTNDVYGRLAEGRTLEAAPRSSGNGDAVPRNRHHTEAVGKGDPQCFDGQAGAAQFAVGERVWVRELPTLFYTRTQEYLRGKPGTIARVSYESPTPEDEAFDREDQPPRWFYIVRFDMADLWERYAGSPNDTLQAEISELWLQADKGTTR